jgi:hypothetical protein
MRGSGISAAFAFACGMVALGCADYNTPAVPVVPVGPPMKGLHAVGNHLENAAGETVVLRGVNRSGSEYMCVSGGGVFDGAWGLTAINAIAAWKANAVRIPLNEACWLGSAPGDNQYKQAIVLFVQLLEQYHIVPILDLHWVGPGAAPADGLQPMPDADHAVDFWTDVAARFADDDGVVFELFNEPFPDSNRDSDAAWQCWSDGCQVTQWAGRTQRQRTSMTYQAVGMKALVAAIRPIAPRQLILLGGVQYSNSLSQWMAHAPDDSNIAAAWHVYNFNGCRTATCWDNAPAAVAAVRPIVATEIGQDDCGGAFISPLMQWLDDRGMGYLAWSWNSASSCIPAAPMVSGRPWPLVVDYSSGIPTGGYAQTFHDHLAGVVASTPP